MNDLVEAMQPQTRALLLPEREEISALYEFIVLGDEGEGYEGLNTYLTQLQDTRDDLPIN